MDWTREESDQYFKELREHYRQHYEKMYCYKTKAYVHTDLHGEYDGRDPLWNMKDWDQSN